MAVRIMVHDAMQAGADGAPRAPRWRALGRATVAIVVAALVGAGLVAAGMAVAREKVNDPGTPLAEPFLPPEMPQSLLVVLGAPGDEIAIAGTLAALEEQGAYVKIIFLADAPTSGTRGVTGEQLQQRANQSAAVLGVDEVGFLGPRMGEILDRDVRRASRLVTDEIRALEPGMVLTYEPALGLYGGDLRRAAASATNAAVRNIVVEGGQTPLRRVITLPVQRVGLVRSASADLDAEYSNDPQVRVASPDVAVPIARHASTIAGARAVYPAQIALMGQLAPHSRLVPPEVYYRVFDREYFADIDVQ